MMRIAAALVLIVGCAPTVSEQMDACVDHNDNWRATNHCQVNILESQGDPMAGVFQGLEALNDATTQYFDAKRDARDRLYQLRVEGKISEYEYLHELCSMSGGSWCSDSHTVTPDGETSDVIVTR